MNHSMLHEKYKEIYSIENITAKMVKWRQTALKFHQLVVDNRNKYARKRKTKSIFKTNNDCLAYLLQN